MLLLGLDFEATTNDPATARVFEVGAVLWDTDTKKPLRLISSLVSDLEEKIPADIETMTGVTASECRDYGLPRERVLKNLHALARRAEVFVAHNGKEYDFPLWDTEIARLECPLEKLDAFRLDTLCDVPYPDEISTRKLGHLAADHGFLNPFSHRAVFDVMTMLTVLSRYPVEQVLHHARQPIFTLVALVEFKNNTLAKDRSYKWDATMRQWRKPVREYLLEKETADLPFGYHLLNAQGQRVDARVPSRLGYS